MNSRPLSNALQRLRLRSAIGLMAALAVVAAGVISAFYSDRMYRQQSVREIRSQAEIMAASTAAALTFDDPSAAQKYVDALATDLEVEAAGVYDADVGLLASFVRSGRPPPAAVTDHPPVFQGGMLRVVQPVMQDGERLGWVYLRNVAEPFERKLSRYSAVGMLALMALIVVAVLASAQTALHRANTELARRNAQLGIQIDEREKAEEALRQSQKLEVIGQITGGVAHDFNNILMVASSGLDLIDRTDDPARRARLTDGIRQAVKRGADLTRQLLAFARRTALRPEVVDLRRQLDGMKMLLERSLQENVEVVFDFAPDLWFVEIDPGQLELSLLNVAVNARDAMPSGGVITISAENVEGVADGDLRGDFVRLSVSDQGMGMSQETLERAFEPFFTTKEVGKGTGLGLSQVYGFTRASGGDVRIQSLPGEGTVVSLYLPRSDRELAEPGAPESRPPRAAGRVLLVEDDDEVAALVGDMLEELGYRVARVRDAAEALARLRHGPAIDVVFSDMVMPGKMNGIELAREIASHRPNLPIVLTTGFSPAAQAAAREGLPLLFKPYSIDALAEVLAAARRA